MLKEIALLYGIDFQYCWMNKHYDRTLGYLRFKEGDIIVEILSLC
jgi:hypothetical protein